MQVFLCLFVYSIINLGYCATKPNIIFLLTDDQDVTAQSLDYMPFLNEILREGGTEFVNYFVPTGLCCPSRSTILSGEFCHNTKVWDNGDLNNSTFLSGGFEKWVNESLEEMTVATIMKGAGYETFLCGKYINGYGDKHADHVPPDWDVWIGMTDTSYFDPHFSMNGSLVKTGKKTYQTDYIRDRSLEFLKGRSDSKPFFMYVAPFAPHAPATPAPRHEKLFSNKQAPRFNSFNPPDEVQHQKPSWLGRLPKLTEKQVEGVDNFYRNRLRSLQAVDEMLKNITDMLDKQGILNNTYIFYMGDNGQHLGDYRLPGGKRQGYDTDIRVPFLVRGPGVPRGLKVHEVVQSVDLLPTWADIASAVIPANKSVHVDGKSISELFQRGTADENGVNVFRYVGLAEMFGGSSNMGSTYKGLPGFEKNRFWNNTYQGIRVINGSDWAAGANWYYAEWCTGEKEFYNLTDDPREIKNLALSLDADLSDKLSAMLHKVGTCSGEECQHLSLPDNYKSIADSYTLPCHNPPDMSTSVEEIDVGFPFSDSDVVPHGWSYGHTWVKDLD
ncbi:N-acetylglucosamine-6-sulfatase-like [Corticium candelabrum]|uniref:N-acetylglucosamine-6-sulfatase-like n=1 Tax=Corticium candelabrum TaxID=121492 RepID=UPI002E25B6A6|nr:N-acetylglucosamine-6-sulfatase-like [Corticium candelabrum]